MKVAYVRASTDKQSTDLQTDALKKSGCEKFFTDIESGAVDDRPGLAAALKFVRRGDTLVVWRLDRLGRSVRHLIDIVNQLGKADIELQSLQENIDTSSPAGKLIFHTIAAIA